MPPKSKPAVSCGVCKVILTDSKETSIGCDKCAFWFHPACQSISDKEFHVLSASTEPWYCEDCKNSDENIVLARPSVEDSIVCMSDQIAKLSAQFSSFNKSIVALESRLDLMEKRLTGYVDDKVSQASSALTESFNNKLSAMDRSSALKHSKSAEACRDANNALSTRLDIKLDEVDAKITGMSAGPSADPIMHPAFVQLSEQVERLEREKRKSNLIIEGIPDCELTKDLCAVIVRLADCLGNKITTADIECVRLGINTTGQSSTRALPVLVKFTSYAVREAVMQNYIGKRNLLLSQIMPELNIATRVYINDHLTPAGSALLKRCSSLKRKNVIKQYFSRHGLMYVKYGTNDRPHKTDHNELSTLELSPPSRTST